MASLYNKQPCRCGHGKSIHYPTQLGGRGHNACRHPGCTCQDYELVMPKPPLSPGGRDATPDLGASKNPGADGKVRGLASRKKFAVRPSHAARELN